MGTCQTSGERCRSSYECPLHDDSNNYYDDQFDFCNGHQFEVGTCVTEFKTVPLVLMIIGATLLIVVIFVSFRICCKKCAELPYPIYVAPAAGDISMNVNGSGDPGILPADFEEARGTDDDAVVKGVRPPSYETAIHAPDVTQMVV